VDRWFKFSDIIVVTGILIDRRVVHVTIIDMLRENNVEQFVRKFCGRLFSADAEAV